ncbi:LacI family DNA-binding transcriptional regulator [Streptomyces sp. 110]|uniref:LacI family DNA-binding transcriptional regulator n=1 Tax=Streptomyces endocoffeicus TaxID=2898945 RepID=A0ABS1Q670_9ACTN|nr:LacI family DNA-binding transcriptional regulator [Streptomyces endocoffeicus]MBL1120152.1 LacI family DNA-binding transcriptional regulator [Streptomyces endocoffeicus]
MTSLQEVADAAGVSRSVASRVLTGDERARISDATRERVRNAADRLQYVPNHRARALRFARSGAVGLIVPDVNNAVFAELLGGVEDHAREGGMAVLLAQIDPPPAGREQLRELVAAGRVDGVLLQRREDFDDAMLGETLTGLQSAVLINSKLPGRTGAVVLDDVAGAMMATRHLIDLGHERIGHLAGVPTHDTAVRRHDGFCSAMREASLPITEEWVLRSGWEAAGGSAAVEQLLRSPTLPTGLVVSSVNAAIGALSALARRGVRVPDDVSVVTINDTWVAETWTPALTTVRMPLRELGRRACDMLIGHLGGAALKDLVVTEPVPELLIRGSTRSVRQSNS